MTITIDLSRREGESPAAHLERIAKLHQLPGHGHQAQETSSATCVGVDTLPAKERAALAFKAAAKRAEALRALGGRRSR